MGMYKLDLNSIATLVLSMVVAADLGNERKLTNTSYARHLMVVRFVIWLKRLGRPYLAHCNKGTKLKINK